MFPAGPQELKERKGEKKVREKDAHKENDVVQPRRVEVLKQDGSQGHDETN
jgi:hypothetical protein